MKDSKLKICFLGEAKKEDIFAVRWAKYFAEKEYDVYLISYSEPGEQNLGKVKVHVIKRKFSIINLWPFNSLINLPFTLRDVKKIVKKIKPDILHAQCVTSYGTLGSLLGFHPFLITVYGSDILINPRKFLFLKWSTKYALGKSDLITCDASHTRESIIRFGVPESKVKIINFGIDTQKFSPGQKDEKLQKELGGSNCKIVISLRNLDILWDVETLVKAIPFVLQVIPNIKFVIAGKGPQENNLKKLSKELKVKDSIKFVGFIANDDLPRYLRTADLYVSTSLSDSGIASSTAEAMACGLPVVVTDTGENKEWIKDGEDGFLIPAKNPQILAEKIIYLFNNEELKKKFGQEGRRIIEERNNYYKEMEKIEEIYKLMVRQYE